VLSITLARPPPTAEEVQYKKGARGDNRAAERGQGVPGAGRKGWRFFADDEDLFGLEAVLQVGCVCGVEGWGGQLGGGGRLEGGARSGGVGGVVAYHYRSPLRAAGRWWPTTELRLCAPQALLFVERGSVVVAPKPWQQGAAPALVARAGQLPAEVRRYVEQLGAASGSAPGEGEGQLACTTG
jgi:hypothetical protein